jgi:hypothetical protein
MADLRSVMSEKFARGLNIGWKHADWKMITSDGDLSNFTYVTESMPINVHGIVIPMAKFLTNSGCQQGIMSCPFISYS